MAVFLSPVGGVAAQFFTNTGAVLTGGKLYTYAAGTTTPQVTYTSSSAATLNTNPIVLDAAGRVASSGEIWLLDGVQYKFVLKDASDVLIATWDNISGINGNFSNFIANQEIQTATAGQTVFTLANPYVVGANTLSVFVDGVNQYGPGAAYAYYETSANTVTFVSGLHVGASVKFTTVQSLTTTQATTAALVSYNEGGAGAITTTVQAKLQQTISVKDFGAVGDGVTDDTVAVQAALLASQSKTLFVPVGTYKITSALTIGGSNTALIGEDGAKFDFALANHSTYGLTLAPDNYDRISVENLILNYNNTGASGILIRYGAPRLRNITINDAYLDGVEISMQYSSFHFVENMIVEDLLVENCGRHGFHIYMNGGGVASNGTPFCNESYLSQMEVRGVGKNYANASAIKFTFDSTTDAATQKISGFTLQQCNFDARIGSAVAPIGNVIYAESVSAGIAGVESLYIKGGGWESSTGSPPTGIFNFKADASINVLTSSIVGVISYNWAVGVNSKFFDGADNYYVENAGSAGRGAYYPKAKAKSNGNAFEAVSGNMGGFGNSLTAYSTSQSLVASSNITFDIPFTALVDYAVQAPFVITLFHQGTYASASTKSYGVYLVNVVRDNTANYVYSSTISSATAGTTSSFNPASVTFSIPSNGTLRVTVPGGASVGSAGQATTCYCAANRMFVGLPFAGLTNITL